MKQANVYTMGGRWFYSLWINGEYDHNDVLEAETAAQARAEVWSVWPDADVRFSLQVPLLAPRNRPRQRAGVL